MGSRTLRQVLAKNSVEFPREVDVDESDDGQEIREDAAREHEVQKHFRWVELEAFDEHPPISNQDAA